MFKIPESVPPTAFPIAPTNPTVGGAALSMDRGRERESDKSQQRREKKRERTDRNLTQTDTIRREGSSSSSEPDTRCPHSGSERDCRSTSRDRSRDLDDRSIGERENSRSNRVESIGSSVEYNLAHEVLLFPIELNPLRRGTRDGPFLRSRSESES